MNQRLRSYLDALRDYIGEARAILLNYLAEEADLEDLVQAEYYLSRAWDIVHRLIRTAIR